VLGGEEGKSAMRRARGKTERQGERRSRGKKKRGRAGKGEGGWAVWGIWPLMSPFPGERK